MLDLKCDMEFLYEMCIVYRYIKLINDLDDLDVFKPKFPLKLFETLWRTKNHGICYFQSILKKNTMLSIKKWEIWKLWTNINNIVLYLYCDNGVNSI